MSSSAPWQVDTQSVVSSQRLAICSLRVPVTAGQGDMATGTYHHQTLYQDSVMPAVHLLTPWILYMVVFSASHRRPPLSPPLAAVASRSYGLPSGGRVHAVPVVHRLAAQPHARGGRVFPGEEPAVALAVGAEALLGGAAGCGPGV